MDKACAAAPWDAPFITTCERIPNPLLIRTFSADGVATATLAITGLGLYRAFLNGRRVGSEYLTPGYNDYNAYLRYQSYDVTALLQKENRLSVALGDGWYRGRFGANGRTNIFGDDYLLSACLTLTRRDGAVERIVTDTNWTAQRSAIVRSSIYDGEERDDTIDAGQPLPCRIVDAPYRPEPAFSPPVRVVSELRAKLLASDAGGQILDFGQNMAGAARFVNRLPRGETLCLQYGETLENGRLCRDNLRSARAEYRYTSDGIEKTVEPWFTYYGFRYVKVIGPARIDPDDFTALALSSGLKPTLTFTTDSDKINRLAKNVLWGQRSNFIDVPTDCPQRDERLGWTGDAQVFAPTACYQMDCKEFYRKYMRDLRADQQRYFSGNIPMYSPCNNTDGAPGGAGWADAATILPWQVYWHCGDRSLLEENYPMMRDYTETLIRADKARGGGHIATEGFCFGDWLALDGATPLAMKGGTDETFIRSAFYYHSLRLTALAAKTLHSDADAKRLEGIAEDVLRALLDEYFTPNGRLSVDTQTGYALALSFGIYRDRAKLAAGLAQRLKKDVYTLKTGFLGTPLLLPALLDNGMTDAAYRMLYREAFPGWLHAVNLGATTIWERWNSLADDGSLSKCDMNSLNHYANGSVMYAVYSRMAGLRNTEPGWRRAIIAPQPNGRMKQMDLAFDSPAGRYRVQWELHDGGMLSLSVELPEGCEAQIVLPDHPQNSRETVHGGRYSYSYRPDVSYLYPFSTDSPVCDLLENRAAAEVVLQQAPQLYGFISAEDCALTMEPLSVLADMLPFIDPTDIERIGPLLKRIPI